ncbi:MAG: glycosyltransferase family 2 protein [Chitinophagaceae bacterium]
MSDNDIKKPWVSFCMSTYNRPGLLKTTLETIAKQTFNSFEVIISDNDPGKSAEIIVGNMNDQRFRYFCNSENLGMIKSFNKSIERAGADHIIMITDDDPVYPHMLETLHDLFIAHPGYGVYHGACDVIYDTLEMAESCRGKLGVNSCLADFPHGHVRTYTSAQFPLAFFRNEVSNYLLWSVCIVRKKILLEIGGVPDYGTPFMGDLAFTVLTSSQEGMVFINTSLGAQVVHGKNFGYMQNDNYAGYYRTAGGFHEWVSARLSKRNDWPVIKLQMEKFIGRWMVGYGLSLRKYLNKNNESIKALDGILKKIFRISYISNWRWKYYISAYFPHLFEYLLKMKKIFFSKPATAKNVG